MTTAAVRKSPHPALFTGLRRYLASLSFARAVLWCYLIWYLVMAGFHFDPAPRLWITSVGISMVIGIALLLSVSTPGSGLTRDRWQTARFFIMPFCVSSFSALVKDNGFILIFSPRLLETGIAIGVCAFFFAVVWVCRRRAGLKV